MTLNASDWSILTWIHTFQFVIGSLSYYVLGWEGGESTLANF